MIQPLSLVFEVDVVVAVSRKPRCCSYATVAYHGPAEYDAFAAHRLGLLFITGAVVAFSSFAWKAKRKSKPPNFGDQYCTVLDRRRWNCVAPPSVIPQNAVAVVVVVAAML